MILFSCDFFNRRSNRFNLFRLEDRSVRYQVVVATHLGTELIEVSQEELLKRIACERRQSVRIRRNLLMRGHDHSPSPHPRSLHSLQISSNPSANPRSTFAFGESFERFRNTSRLCSISSNPSDEAGTFETSPSPS